MEYGLSIPDEEHQGATRGTPVVVPEDVYVGLAYARRKGYGSFSAWGPPSTFLIYEGYVAAGMWIIDNAADYQRGAFSVGFVSPGKRGLKGLMA